MRALVVLGTALATVGLACSDSGGTGSSDSDPQGFDAQCVVVSDAFDSDLPELRAVRLEKPNETGRASSLWAVSSATGATWLMRGGEEMPTTGPILPLNPEARAESIYGIDAPLEAPVFEGITASDPAAVASRECWGS